MVKKVQEKMISVRLHGRGGQGVKKAAQILARAAYLAGYYTQDFALYGAERRGAPVTSFVRLSKKPIGTRGYVWNPDFIIVLDDTLELSCHLEGRKKTTRELINTEKDLKLTVKYCRVDATGVAVKILGKNIPNIALLGAFVKIFEPITLEHLAKAVEIELGRKHPEAVKNNLQAAKICYEKVIC
ncbi:2-oxoacid:acceptor oxidoreductase family protein [Candidatus Woesearchaeota archaeon]|nr:2-oxoacid:acceptor oxidoreductase family protein [Candidatus Woesearchaeota archaeon]